LDNLPLPAALEDSWEESWIVRALLGLLEVVAIAFALAFFLAFLGVAVIYAATFVLGPLVLTRPTVLLDYVPRLWSAATSPSWVHYELPTLFLIGWVGGLIFAVIAVTWARTTLDKHERDLSFLQVAAAYTALTE
jgi:hypothetical protein